MEAGTPTIALPATDITFYTSSLTTNPEPAQDKESDSQMEAGTPTIALPATDVDATTAYPERSLGVHQAQSLVVGTDGLDEPAADGEAQDRALRALEVAAVHGFMESVRSAQTSCLRLCNACRESVPVHRLRISRDVPLSILAIVYPELHQEEANASSRVLPYRTIRKVMLTFGNSFAFLAEERPLAAARRRVLLGIEARDTDYMVEDTTDMSQVQWPEGTAEISLCRFNHSVNTVAWPSRLEMLSFGDPRHDLLMNGRTPDSFDMPLDGVTFPAGLRQVFLGDRFNQPIEGIDWPVGLERLSLPGFDQSIRNVQWPPGLKSLEFVSPSKIAEWGDEADREHFMDSDYDSPGYTPMLRRVQRGFNQPIDTTLPASLQSLWLSEDFHQPLDNVSWPCGLVVLGLEFSSCTRYPGSITWPSSLLQLYMVDKPECAEGFSYPQGCEVAILTDTYGDFNVERVDCYDRDEDPNEFSDSERYDHGYPRDDYDGYALDPYDFGYEL